MYVLIRRIHFLELVFAFDWVSKEEYTSEITELIPKYNNLKNMLRSMCSLDILSFAREFKLVEELKVVENASERASTNQMPGSEVGLC